VKAGYTKADVNVYFIDFRANKGTKSYLAADKMVDRIGTFVEPVKDKVGMLWLDVEGSKGGVMWSSSTKQNCDWFTSVVKLLRPKAAEWKVDLGIYTGMYTWSSIVGSCPFDAFKDLPLWYAAYDSSLDTFKDFRPMLHAWSEAAAHQWHGTTKFCGSSVDFNVFKK